MSMSRTELRRHIQDNRRRWMMRLFWFVTTAAVAGTAGIWLWNWTGAPVYLD
jgi:hypothetical protein